MRALPLSMPWPMLKRLAAAVVLSWLTACGGGGGGGGEATAGTVAMDAPSSTTPSVTAVSTETAALPLDALAQALSLPPGVGDPGYGIAVCDCAALVTQQ